MTGNFRVAYQRKSASHTFRDLANLQERAAASSRREIELLASASTASDHMARATERLR